MKRLKGLFAAALLVAAAACAAAGTGSGGGAGRSMILRDEIAANGAADAYTLVQSLRPQWLRVRGDNSRGTPIAVETGHGETGVGEGFAAGSPNVYLNNARMGSAESLRQIPLSGVQYVRFFNAAEANLRWGAGNAHGAILVSTEPLPTN